MNGIMMTLRDDTHEKTWDLLEVPLVSDNVDGITQVETKNGNIHTYFRYRKKKITHTWKYLTREEYDEIDGFCARQFETFKYPLLTIAELGIENMPVYVEIGERSVMSNGGMVEQLKITMRETGQN